MLYLVRWKVHESCLLVIPLVAEGVASGHVQFDIHRVMTDLVIPNLMANSECSQHVSPAVCGLITRVISSPPTADWTVSMVVRETS